jgi:hypothetical protein
MHTATVHKNIGLMIFLLACALMLAFSVNVHAQGRGNGNGNKQILDRKDTGRSKGKVKVKDARDDRGSRVIYDDQDDRINGRDRRGNQSERFAYDRGYRQGLKDGKRAAREGRRTDVFSTTNYPANGNRSGWGNSDEWRRAFDEGYRRGYREAYDRYRRENRRILGIPLPF